VEYAAAVLATPLLFKGVKENTFEVMKIWAVKEPVKIWLYIFLD
jgi:hypothetical protein